MSTNKNSRATVAGAYNEARVVGAILNSAKTVIPVLLGEVNPEDFRDPRHVALVRVAFDLHRKGEGIDATTIASELAKRKELRAFGFDDAVLEAYREKFGAAMPFEEQVTGATEAVLRLVDVVPADPAQAVSNARLVRKVSQLDRMREQFEYAMREAEAGHFDPETLLGDVQAYIQQEIALATRAPVPIGDGIAQLASHYTAMKAAKGRIVKTGIRAVDVMFSRGGLSPGLTIIAARPGVGKSSLASTIAVNAGRRSRILFIQAELAGWQTSERVASILAGRHARNVFEHKREMWGDLEQMSGELRVSVVADGARPTLQQIAGHAHRLYATQGIDALIFDQLSKIEREGRNEKAMREHEWYGLCGDRLRTLGIELGIPVILLHQINRASKESRRPGVHNLKGCGKLEEDADAIILMDRDNVAEAANRDRADGMGDTGDRLGLNQAWIAVAKNRDGHTGDATVGFDPETGSVYDVEPQRLEPKAQPRDRVEPARVDDDEHWSGAGELRDDVPFDYAP